MIVIVLIDNSSSEDLHTNVEYAIKILERFIEYIFSKSPAPSEKSDF